VRGLKLLINRYTKHRIMLLVSVLLMAGMLAAVMIFHADMGAESTESGDYMLCKIMALFPVVIAADLPVIFMAYETQGSRFMRATPCAARMYRVDIPVFSTLTTFAWLSLSVLAYSVFILVTDRDIANISDILVPAAILGFVFTIVMCCLLTLKYGVAAFFVYYLPVLVVMDIFGAMDSGTGIPLWLAVVLYFVAFGAGLGVSALIAGLAFAKGNFKALTYSQGRVA
jgi:hypothetical protein